jgi:uncharacterized protein YggU (UPF0235/DUF167 family)
LTFVTSGFFRPVRGGIELFVRLTPHASKDEIGSVETTADGRAHVAARVRAIPDKGKANAALEKLVASWLGVPRTNVSVSAGFTQRLKTLRIEGEAEALASHIQARVRGLGKAVDSG